MQTEIPLSITEHEEILYSIALTFVPGIGAKTARNLKEHYGSATAVFKTAPKELRHAEGIGEVKAKGFQDKTVVKSAEKELNFVLKNEITVLTFGNPSRLANCQDAPFLLYYKGTANLNAAKTVAIVGTRKNTDYGAKLCEELVEGLRQLPDILVLSGLALGIDAVAHNKCLATGVPTVGVLGHGLDRIYPSNHQAMATKMVESGGGLVAEFPSGTMPDKNNFPMRNRIVAGLADATVVVESNVAGGALITAYLAAGYNREVFAYPGRTSDTRSAGCNDIIRKNIAALITCPTDLIEMMGWATDKKPKAVQQQLFVNLTEPEQKIVQVLQAKDAVHSDDIFLATGITNSQLAATLLQLEMNGIVKTLPGKMYRLQ
jgi:DNA processing protein